MSLTIAGRLKLTRRALGLTKTDFSSAADIAINTYSQWESGDRSPDLVLAIRLCDRFELTLDWIYRGDLSGLRHGLAQRITELKVKENA